MQAVRPYGALFCCDLQVLTGTTSNGLINPSSHPIHKLFGMEVEDDFISEETRCLLDLENSLMRMRMTG